MNLYQIYFSPTGGTRKAAFLVGDVWGKKAEEIDLSERDLDFTRYIFEEKDICIISVPSFGGRVPDTALSRLRRMTGKGARAVLLAVYGNREFDDTLLELKNVLSEAGFFCVAAIAAVAEHSIMHQYGQGRPDAADEGELAKFGKKVKKLLEENETVCEVQVPGNMPYREYGGVPFKPKAGGKCVRCGLCARKCPAGAIPADDPSGVDPEKCISCMRCVSICPQHARGLNKLKLAVASKAMQKACSGRKQNRLFLNTKEQDS